MRIAELRIVLSIVTAILVVFSGGAQLVAADKVVLATNWLAQPELGGFYQALADGTYAKHGLDVKIKPGGPMVNNRPLLSFGRADFLIGTNLLQAFDAVKQQIPTKAVAAFFQKDPQCILAHADGPVRTWDDLKRAPMFIGNSGRQTFFLWMNAAQGFPRANLRPYNHSLAPFLNDKTAAMQGFATAEPHRITEASGEEPRVFLLADHGWNSYSTVLETRVELIEQRPELVQRFVDASIAGWRTYLAGGDGATDADAMIKKNNPSMTDGLINFSRATMLKLELLGAGEIAETPIGVMNAERVRDFYQQTVKAGMYKPGEVRPEAAVTLQFVEQETVEK
ncbi:MAG: ABC transporter substrate-binding protein [Pirellulales bacterium]|nr:ABC transporter substrate-binding protein [Pirellulales bacterium]